MAKQNVQQNIRYHRRQRMRKISFAGLSTKLVTATCVYEIRHFIIRSYSPALDLSLFQSYLLKLSSVHQVVTILSLICITYINSVIFWKIIIIFKWGLGQKYFLSITETQLMNERFPDAKKTPVQLLNEKRNGKTTIFYILNNFCLNLRNYSTCSTGFRRQEMSESMMRLEQPNRRSMTHESFF